MRFCSITHKIMKKKDTTFFFLIILPLFGFAQGCKTEANTEAIHNDFPSGRKGNSDPKQNRNRELCSRLFLNFIQVAIDRLQRSCLQFFRQFLQCFHCFVHHSSEVESFELGEKLDKLACPFLILVLKEKPRLVCQDFEKKVTQKRAWRTKTFQLLQKFLCFGRHGICEQGRSCLFVFQKSYLPNKQTNTTGNRKAMNKKKRPLLP